MPISRVRSVTDTSMIFMMPMPPTINETEAMLPSSNAMTVALLDAASAISDKFLHREIVVGAGADSVSLPE